ncbi:MAG TPA: sodium:solute symporter [Sedimentisphaerales bacterium]|nr:sodium:solute symporter [Sedimentisphaerales bacterium]
MGELIAGITGEKSMHILDWIVVLCYFGTIVSMGVYFSKRQKTTGQYYTGGRSMPAWAVGISILATLISSITFLAYPGAGFEGKWILLVQGLMVPIVLVCLIWIIVPMYRNIIGISTYEFFDKRFGYGARLYSSIAFSLAHFIKMGTVFYLLSMALASMTGVSTYNVILVLGIIVILYTLLGGIEGVVWCEVIQGFLLMGGGLICIAVLLFRPAGGPVNVISTAWENKKFFFGPYDMDLTKLTFIVMALNGIFYALQKYGTDQTIVQRFLVAKSDKAAEKAALIGVLLCVPVWTLFMFIGTCLWSYYHITDIQLPAQVLEKADRVFPYFIMDQLPIGVTGLILAALMSAALSSLDADLNCLSAVIVEDYYHKARPNSTDKQRLVLGKIIVVVCGISAMLIASAYVVFSDKGVLGTVFGLYAIVSGGIAGLFVLGFFTTRTNRKGCYVGIIACIIFTAWAFVTKQGYITLPWTLRIPWTEYTFKLNFTHHKYMLGVYSHLVLFFVAYIASFFFKADKDLTGLTFYGWRKTHKKVAEVAKEL